MPHLPSVQEHIWGAVPLWKSRTLPQLYHLQNRNCVLCLTCDCRGAGAVLDPRKVARKGETFIQRGYTEIWQKLLLEILLTSAQSDQLVLFLSSPVQGLPTTAPAQGLSWESLKGWGNVCSFEVERFQEYLFFGFHSPFLDGTSADFYSSHATPSVAPQDKSASKV